MIDLEFCGFGLPLSIPSDDGTYLCQFLKKEAAQLNTMGFQNYTDDESASVHSADSLKYYERRQRRIGQQAKTVVVEEQQGK
jgi:hypothetical protein